MLTGRIPFQSYGLKKHDASDASFILDRILDGNEFDEPLMPNSGLSYNVKSVIRGLLAITPAHRLSIHQLVSHPWLCEPSALPPLMPAFQSVDSFHSCHSVPTCPPNTHPSGGQHQQLPRPLYQTTTTGSSSTSFSSSASDGRSTEDSTSHSPNMAASGGQKRTLKMKLKKKHTSSRKHGKNGKLVEHFEVLNSEDLFEEGEVVDNRVPVVFKPMPSATSYNSAYDSGVQSLTSHHQSCCTASSNNSTGSRERSSSSIEASHLQPARKYFKSSPSTEILEGSSRAASSNDHLAYNCGFESMRPTSGIEPNPDFDRNFRKLRVPTINLDD